MDHHYASHKASELTIFHNNICSINANFEEIETNLFANCSKYPDVMAFSDTQLIKDESAPVLKGSGGAGGGSAYLANSMQYSVCTEFSFNEKKVEDLWLKLK